MFADTDAIRALGTANSSQAADLAAIATTLSMLPGAAAPRLGPVGARFLAALAAAVEQESRAVAALSERAAEGSTAAHASATAYSAADRGLGATISRV